MSWAPGFLTKHMDAESSKCFRYYTNGAYICLQPIWKKATVGGSTYNYNPGSKLHGTLCLQFWKLQVSNVPDVLYCIVHKSQVFKYKRWERDEDRNLDRSLEQVQWQQWSGMYIVVWMKYSPQFAMGKWDWICKFSYDTVVSRWPSKRKNASNWSAD